MIQEFSQYTAEDRRVWKTLFERQVKNLQNKACSDYLYSLEKMQDVLHAADIPRFSAVNEWFQDHTGWEIEVVPGLIPVEDFFGLLAEKKFCSSTWLRTMQQLDYLEEPDMFHDTFGHIPLLVHPLYSDFMQTFGKIGRATIGNEERIRQLQRLYWFTIEFGLMKSASDRRIYGAGILSSFGETNRSLESDVEVMKFDIESIISRNFITSEPQNLYFELDTMEQLFHSLKIFEHATIMV